MTETTETIGLCLFLLSVFVSSGYTKIKKSNIFHEENLRFLSFLLYFFEFYSLSACMKKFFVVLPIVLLSSCTWW